MQEVELKILNIDVEDVKKKLGVLGAKPLGERLIVEYYYDYPDGRILAADQLFRLRKIGDKAELAFKDGRTGDDKVKIQEETEALVNDFEATNKIIERLGFKRVRHREKKRETHELGEIHFEIEHYPQIPPYLEIEGPRELIEQAVVDLGFTLDQAVSLTATEVLSSYGAKAEHLVFGSN